LLWNIEPDSGLLCDFTVESSVDPRIYAASRNKSVIGPYLLKMSTFDPDGDGISRGRAEIRSLRSREGHGRLISLITLLSAIFYQLFRCVSACNVCVCDGFQLTRGLTEIMTRTPTSHLDRHATGPRPGHPAARKSTDRRIANLSSVLSSAFCVRLVVRVRPIGQVAREAATGTIQPLRARLHR
jgi:hypothetical protein